MSSLPDPAPRKRPTWVEIDLAAFEHNVAAIARSLPSSVKLIAVLKANGYGHGAVELARRCTPDKVAMIAVSLLEEALELRLAGIVLPILVLGPVGAEHVETALEHDLTLGVPGPEELEGIVAAARDRDVSIHLKLDSGMGRMGVVETELPRVAELLRGSRVRLDAIYTHLANASDPEDPFTDEQIARFHTLVETLREAGIGAPRVHVANSAATLRGMTPGDFARVGIALYGAEALEARVCHPERRARDLGDGRHEDHVARPTRPGPSLDARDDNTVLLPVMRWRTEIARLKELPAGSAIGYGTTFRTSRPSRIATLPVGYADGYDRRFSNKGEVLVRGCRAPVVGRVSMDLVTIDVTDVPGAAVGDEVVLLGDGMRVEELAGKLDTIAYEVFCAISARVPRVYR